MEKITANELIKRDIRGKIVCFPTDTVYGVGALVDDIDQINKIYKMKNRDSNKPLAILTGSKNIDAFVEYISPEAQKYIDEEWPGALTLIFKKNKNIDDAITKGFDTIAFRMPNSITSLKILNHFGLMAVTSVNVSGSKELVNVSDIEEYFGDWIDYIVIDEEASSKQPSRIIDVSKKEITIIR